MTVEILSQFSETKRRSVSSATGDLLTGRWVALNANGQAVLPGSADKAGLYLLLEGDILHIGDNTDFDGSGVSQNSEALPSNQAVGAVALAYGIYRYRTGPEGVLPSDSFAVGDSVGVDAEGRIIAGGTLKHAVVENVTTDAGGVTELVLRTLGN